MRITALVTRIVKQTLHDKRTLALMMLAPLVVLALVYFLFNSGDNVKLRLGVYNTSEAFNTSLKDADLNVIEYDDKDNIKNKIIDNDLDGFIYIDDNNLNLTYENSSPQNSQKIKSITNNILMKDKLDNILNLVSTKVPNLNIKNEQSINIEESYIYGDEDMNYFDTINPMLIGFFVFFFVFLVSGISLLKERSSGTLYKLLATPIKRYEIVLGYLLGYGIFALIQTIIVVLFAVYVLNMKIVGSIYLVLLVNVIIALVALSLGTLLSTFANSEFQMMQFIPIIIVPQIFFAGLIPLDSMASWLQKIAYIIPLNYGANALSNIIIKGFTFSQIQNDVYILILFVVILSALNILCLKKYRKI
ncbi:ABC transporter permease [Clostridioides difficile]